MRNSILAVLLAVSTPALADGQYPVNTTIKGYPKRDRILASPLEYSVLSQLHEVKGFRASANLGLTTSDLKNSGTERKVSAPTGSVAGFYGNDQIAFALQAAAVNATIDAEKIDAEDTVAARKFIPQVAGTIANYYSLGGGIEINQTTVTENRDSETEYDLSFNRPFVAFSYHNGGFEVGAMYAGEVQAQDKVTKTPADDFTLTFTTSDESVNQRATYIPAETTVFSRWNFTDNWTAQGSLTASRYDGNVSGAVDVFDTYALEDRLASKAVVTYWTPARSRLSFAADYKGAATAAIGADETGLGYRLTNNYGASAEGVLAIDRRAYVGAMLSMSRGERDQSFDDGTRIAAREETTKVIGSLGYKF